ncbi:MAG: outer membrane protein assembly factor BamB [Gammaproteobacteria bacterium]|nr:outer membrane protein assembly factor BamB [Gammaproteobacteria bacterium]
MPGSTAQALPHWVRTAVLTLLAGALIIPSAGCSLFGGDDDEELPAELVKFKPTIRIKKVWSANLGDDSESLRLALQPASDGARVFAAAHDGKVSAFEAEKGKRLWRQKTKLQLSGGPATDGDVVVLGSSNGEVVALNAADGKQRWRTNVSSEVLAAPAIAGGVALVRTVDGKLAALDLIDGRQRWFVQQVMPRLTVRGTGAPVVIRDMVFCGFDNGKLASYSLADGSVGWEVLLDPPAGRNEVERLADIKSTIRAIGEDLYVVGYRGQLASVAAESGQVMWSRDVRSYEGLTVDLQNVYVSGASSELSGMSRQTGSELWKHEQLKFRDISGPAAYQNSVVVGDFEGYVHFFDTATGASQARVRAGSDRVTSPPVVVNETIYVQTDGGDLAAFRQRAK